MSRNALKIIACISMLIDHIGLFLFPKVVALRCIGRIAMPIFAFFIAEGCCNTRSKRKYFLNVLSLAVLCQLAYLAEEVFFGGIGEVNLNILFTLAMSQVLCFLFLEIQKACTESDRRKIVCYAALFIAAIAAFAVVCSLKSVFSLPVTVDYGLAGILLPLFAVLFSDRKRQFVSFAFGVLVLNIAICGILPYTWFSLLALPLIRHYNGEKGVHINKWFFYAFYPLHMALIFVIGTIVS